MAFSKAVWFEPMTETIYSDVVPSNWIIDGHLYWPHKPKERKFFVERTDPDLRTWKKFKILKIKLKTDDYNAAKNEPDSVTESSETDGDVHEKPSERKSSLQNTVCKKKMCNEKQKQNHDVEGNKENSEIPVAPKKIRGTSGRSEPLFSEDTEKRSEIQTPKNISGKRRSEDDAERLPADAEQSSASIAKRSRTTENDKESEISDDTGEDTDGEVQMDLSQILVPNSSSPGTSTQDLDGESSHTKYLRKIFQRLTEIRSVLHELRGTRLPQNPEDEVQKCETQEEFRCTEVALRNNAVQRAKLLQAFKRVGGHTTRKKVDRMLDKIFTPVMLTRLNMKGQRTGKYAFLGSEVSKILISAVLQTSGNDVTEADVEKHIKSILKGASARKAAKQK